MTESPVPFPPAAGPAGSEHEPVVGLVDDVALSLLPISWWRAVRERLRAGDPPAEVLHRLLAERRPDASGRPAGLRQRAAAALAQAAERGLAPVAWSDPAYPPSLAAIVDPPPVLWLRGRPSSFEAPAVAIVGSRAASPYGLAVAEWLAGDLASRGVLVVSGLARGIDSAAHRGALAAAGRTVAVLGSGADVVYPREHQGLAREIADSGAVLSELPPGTPPRPQFFPQRNRLISGLSRAVVVIEAGEKSGSLITARTALEQGRDVLAVPGNVLNGRNRGAHSLLRDGAKIVESADDILEELGVPTRGPALPALEADPLLACFTPGEPSDLDALAERAGLPTSRLLPRLLELELHGRVRRAGGGRFVRVDRSC
jgi:DNA processing protein